MSLNFEVSVSIKSELESKPIVVHSYSELTALISGLSADVRILRFYEKNDPSVSKVRKLPSLAHLPKLYCLTLTGFHDLTTLPAVSQGHMIGTNLLVLNVFSCPRVDLSILPQGLLEIKIHCHSFIETITIPSITRRVTIKNSEVGMFIPPSDSHQYLPFRGMLVLDSSPFWYYPKLMWVLNYPSVSNPIIPRPTMTIEDCSEAYLNPNMDDVDLDNIQPDPESVLGDIGYNPMYRMYETYQIFDQENRKIFNGVFPLLFGATFRHLRFLNSIDMIEDIHNIQNQLPIERAATLQSHPLRRALEYI
jgi:hypothetical protein